MSEADVRKRFSTATETVKHRSFNNSGDRWTSRHTSVFAVEAEYRLAREPIHIEPIHQEPKGHAPAHKEAVRSKTPEPETFKRTATQEVINVPKPAAEESKSSSVLGKMCGFFKGVGESAWGLVEGVGHMVRHPIDTVVGLGRMIRHPIRTLSALGHAIKEQGKKILSGDTEALGKTIGDLATLILAPEAEGAEAAEGLDAAKALDTEAATAELTEGTEAAGKTTEDVASSESSEVGAAQRQQTPTDRLKEHLTEADLDAAKRESSGEVVARKADGTPYDHITEVREAQRGLLRRIDRIRQRLGYPNLGEAERIELSRELGEASKLLDKSERYLPR